MIVVNIVIQCGAEKDGKVDTHLEYNLLKREDVTNAETQIAKAIEKVMEVFIKSLPTGTIKNFTRID